MRSARAGVLFSALVFFSSAAAAHAHADFTVTETQARAGDVVHFAITAAKSRVTYELEIDDRDVLKGSSAGSLIAGEFTMPDLGERARTVKVEAEMRESGKGKKKVKQKLEYLGLALVSPAADPPAATPAPAAAAPQADPPSAVVPDAVPAAPPPPAPKAAATPVAPVLAVKRETRRSPAPSTRERPARRADAQRKRTVHRRERTAARRPAAARRHRAGRLAPRTAPLFDGVPERGSRRFEAGAAAGPTFAALNAIVPPTASLGAEAAERDRLGLALLVPALAAMAAIALAGTAIQRQRALRRG